MRIPLRGGRRGIALAGALCAAVGLVAVPAATAAPTMPAPPVPTLDWQPCDPGFSCATATVPLDYANPSGATIQLALIKHPATDPAHRIGSLFFYPGEFDSGPGPGVSTLPPLYPRFAPDVRARFDVISWDPRGLAHSTDLQCFDTIDEEDQLVTHRPLGFPIGAAEDRAWETVAGQIDDTCAARGVPLLAHDTTADTARDLDLLRQAVGDPTMNFLGNAYGSYLGATYANLFPDKVRAITLDGAFDPVAWATGTNGSANRLGAFLREGADVASAAAMNAFLDLCGRATTTACAFSAGSPAATRAKWTTLLDRVASHPITLSGTTFTEAVVASVSGGLYSVQSIPNLVPGWADVASVLQTLWTRSTGGSAPAGAAGPATVPNNPGPYLGREEQLGVVCSDSPFPRNPNEYPAQAAFAAARSNLGGAAFAWGAEGCSQWPVLAPQRYTGPWNHPTAAPILVIGTTVNPYTPYADAVAMTHDLANARLLTVHGYGNNALVVPSACVNAAEDAYYVTGALPAPGTVCQQDQAPFAG